MNIYKNMDGTTLKIKLEGRLDTTTAPQLEEELKEDMKNADNLEFDFEKLDYISSAGLRILLAAQKVMNGKQGNMELKNVNEVVMEVFEITGFVDILNIAGTQEK